MRNKVSVVSAGRLALDGALGAVLGAVAVVLVLAFDVFGFGTMVRQTQYGALFIVLMLVRPMMFVAVCALAWSLWRQLHSDATSVAARAAPAFRLRRAMPALFAKT